MTTIAEKQKQRFQFLKLVHDATGGSETQIVNMWDLGNELGWDKQTTDVTAQYLVGEGLIKFWTISGGLGITHWGVRQIEDALANPQEQTEYFPPVINLIQIESMVNSQIQQAGPEAIQSQITGDQFDIEAIGRFLGALKSSMDQLELIDSSLNDLKGEIATIEAQMQVSKPKETFIKECLRSIRGILEEAAGQVVATGLLATLSQLT